MAAGLDSKAPRMPQRFCKFLALPLAPAPVDKPLI